MVLLGADIDIDIRDLEGNTALSVAASEGKIEFVKELL